MARRNAKRDALAAEVKRRQGAASDKIYRLEKQGVRVRGTEYDPRLAASELGNLTAAQLRAQLKKINEFQNRGNQYEAGVGGTPLPRRLFQQYKAEEALYNAKTREVEAKRLDRKLPGQDATVGRMLEMRGDVQQRAFQQINRQAKFFTGPEDMKKLIQNLKDKNKPDYLGKSLQPRLNSIYALLEHSGNADLIDVVKNMDKDAQLTLLDYSTFGQIAQERFSSGDDSEVSAEDAAYQARTGHSREVDVRSDLERVINWSNRGSAKLEFGAAKIIGRTPRNSRGRKR